VPVLVLLLLVLLLLVLLLLVLLRSITPNCPWLPLPKQYTAPCRLATAVCAMPAAQQVSGRRPGQCRASAAVHPQYRLYRTVRGRSSPGVQPAEQLVTGGPSGSSLQQPACPGRWQQHDTYDSSEDC